MFSISLNWALEVLVLETGPGANMLTNLRSKANAQSVLVRGWKFVINQIFHPSLNLVFSPV